VEQSIGTDILCSGVLGQRFLGAEYWDSDSMEQIIGTDIPCSGVLGQRLCRADYWDRDYVEQTIVTEIPWSGRIIRMDIPWGFPGVLGWIFRGDSLEY